ncbi:LysR family transcriptional regulator [Actibacterium ureilyticum]|jgi:DNA-binding transcriptional LysR family regulator|uniref:LysR family transcriptional regulator n=1 Tax=Actibacterium ureilyticum TaxID=1590614 RepID=UPI000BAB163E|nr:LysR family transcriptional regulator [Actibacterium ureilyticum]
MNKIHSRYDRLDLNLLRVFAMVWQERHLTRAADALSLTPSAVSHAMRRLRDHFGEPLFQRQGHRMQPTAACARMAPELLDQLTRLDALINRWGAFDPQASQSSFRIALPEATETILLPVLMSRLAAEAPAVTVHSVRVARAMMAKSLAARSIDLAVDVPHPVPETLRHAPLFSDDFCVVSRAGHGFAATPTFAAYAAADHIAVSTRHDGAVIEDVSLLALGISRRVRLRCQSYGTAMTVAEGSDLLATIPRRIAARLQPGRALVLTDPPAALSPVKLHLYWHADQHTDPASQWLRGLLRP